MGHCGENLKLLQAALTDLFAPAVGPVILNPGCTLESPHASTQVPSLETLIWGRAYTSSWPGVGFILLLLKSDSNTKPGLRTTELIMPLIAMVPWENHFIWVSVSSFVKWAQSYLHKVGVRIKINWGELTQKHNTRHTLSPH